jgi:L-threonylcarbamoyladenylate synthase
MPIHARLSSAGPVADVIEQAAAVVRAGGLVAYPTDTLYALGVDPFNAAAVERLFDAKGRKAETAIPLIAADVEQIEAALGVLPEVGARLASAFWPGPLTLVIPSSSHLAPRLLGGRTTVAVRVPAHPVAVALARAVGRPITSTSANRSGEEPAATPDGVLASLGEVIDVLIDAGPCRGGAPSTIVDVTCEPPGLVRTGAVLWDRVLQSLRE